jgi:two-component system NtrC family sensor kinase
MGAEALTMELPTTGRRVLLLEDDPDIAEPTSAILKDAGYSVEWFRNGRDALDGLRESPVDLILLDLMMPVMDGWEFRSAQRADRSIAGIPVIVLTADTGAKATAIHAEVCLRKPYGARELVDTVERVLVEDTRRRANASAEETGRLALLGTIAAGVGHEVNNPLSFAMGNLELIEEVLPALRREVSASWANREPSVAAIARHFDTLDEQLRDLRTGLERVRLVVRNLQNLSRRADNEHGRVDLQRVLESAISMAWSHIKYRAVLTRSYAPLPEIWGSESRLGQVFLNLLVNAAQGVRNGEPQSNRIEVTTRMDGESVAVEVKDSGEGMSKALLSRIFEPFFTTKGQGEGTGLGLPICREIIREHGGTIDVESELGRGTRFTVRLPVGKSGEWRAASTAVAAPPQPSLPARPGEPRPRLWIVDDERLVARAVGQMLQRDYDVILMHAAKEVLARLEAGERFDALLCDVMMPEMNGVALTQNVVSRWPELRSHIVFMSGGALVQELDDFVRGPDYMFIEKPVHLARLRELIARAAGAVQAGAGV